MPGVLTQTTQAKAGNAFASYHAAVAVAFFACALVFTMISMNPACIAVSLAGSLACLALLQGWRRAMALLLGLAPLWLLVALVNGVLSAGQAEEALSLGPVGFALPSFLFGLSAGGMLVAVMIWCACAGSALSIDALRSPLARFAPNLALMLAQVLQLVPQMLRRGRTVAEAQRASLQGSDQGGKRGRWRGALRVTSVLVGWSMEDGAIRDESMRARGFGAQRARSCYRQRRLRADDVVLLALIGTVGAIACIAAGSTGALFQFYPVVSAKGSLGACLPGAVLMLLPASLYVREALLWR